MYQHQATHPGARSTIAPHLCKGVQDVKMNMHDKPERRYIVMIMISSFRVTHLLYRILQAKGAATGTGDRLEPGHPDSIGARKIRGSSRLTSSGQRQRVEEMPLTARNNQENGVEESYGARTACE